jgi:hypothetical protein
VVDAGCRCSFLDGSHTEESRAATRTPGSPSSRSAARSAIHDVFPNPADGGQAPFGVYTGGAGLRGLRGAAGTGSLRLLRRLR